MKKYDAFNLTFFTILGGFILLIVFAVTTVIDSLAQSENKRRFKNIYSTYQTVLLNTIRDIGGDTGCYFSTDPAVSNDYSGCDYFYQTFLSNFKIQRYCQQEALRDGCIPQYETYTTNEQCNGFTKEMIEHVDDVFVLDDGSILIIYNEENKQYRPIFAIDVNGFSKPNKAGVDLFSLMVVRDGNGSYFFHGDISYCLPVEEDGIKNVSEIYN